MRMNFARTAAMLSVLVLCLDLQIAKGAGEPPEDAPPGPPPRGFSGRGGPGGPGGPMREKMKLVQKFDRNGDGILDSVERKAAREFIQAEQAEGRGPRRPGGRGFGPGNEEETKPGAKVSVAEVKKYPQAPLYDPLTLRTFFLQFESADWEKELADFKNSDVDVPATLTVDGKVYKDVGMHFRGASSFMMVGEGRKRSLNLSLNYKIKG